jgi:hypothetical protein
MNSFYQCINNSQSPNRLSWRLIVDLDTQKQLFYNLVKTGYKIYLYDCSCGNKEFIMHSDSIDCNYNDDFIYEDSNNKRSKESYYHTNQDSIDKSNSKNNISLDDNFDSCITDNNNPISTNFKFICPKCGNEEFYDANEAIANIDNFLYCNSLVKHQLLIEQHSFWGYDDYKLECNIKLEQMSRDLRIKYPFIKASYYLSVPYDIEFITNRVFYKKIDIYSYGVDREFNIVTDYRLDYDEKIFDSLKEEINNKITKEYQLFNIPKPDRVYVKKHNIKEVVFFNKHKNFKEYDFYLWRYADEFDIKDISVKKALELISNNRAKSIKKALFKNYLLQIENLNRYDHKIVSLFIELIEDDNILKELIECSFVNINLTDSEIERFKDMLIFLLHHYSQKSLLKLFKDIDIDDYEEKLYFIDTLNSFTDAKSILSDEFEKVKCNLYALHDEFMVCADANFYLNMQHHKFNYNSSEIEKCIEVGEYRVEVPKTPKELYIWAKRLHNCLTSYYHNIINKHSTIYGFFMDDKLEFAIEVDTQFGQIIQYSGNYNKELNSKQFKVLEAWRKRFGIDSNLP